MLVNIRDTIKDIGNFSILLGIVIFIYALVGMELFSYTNKNPQIKKSRTNFDYFGNALVSIFIVLIGEDWDKLMIDIMVQIESPAVAAVFFVSLVIIGNMILLNLFLAILLKNFENKAEVDEDKKEVKATPLVQTLKRHVTTFIGKIASSGNQNLQTLQIKPHNTSPAGQINKIGVSGLEEFQNNQPKVSAFQGNTSSKLEEQSPSVLASSREQELQQLDQTPKGVN